MSLTKVLTLVVRCSLALTSLTLGCQLIAGIEDRHLAASPECEDYCDAVTSFCTGQTSVYLDRASCLGTCAHLDLGNPADAPGTNTVACRTQAAKAAGDAPAEALSDCPLAGPGGGPDQECGPDCESYCHLLLSVCPRQASDASLTSEECLRQCPALRQSFGFNVRNFQTGDTLECRINHVVAATQDPDQCADAMIAPKNPVQPCTDDPNGEPNCTDYCRVIQVACTGEFAVYDDEAQCLKSCAALPKGLNQDSGGKTMETTESNSVGCRKFHAYSGLTRPHNHCPHAGPTGQGYCGDKDKAICESYCMILKQSCATDYAAHFNDDAACQAECQALEGSEEEDELDYFVGEAESIPGSVNCRMLHATRAFADPTNECPIAFGMAAPCQ